MSEGTDPRALVRPYTVTRGRTATASAWPPETVVAAVDQVPAQRAAPDDDDVRADLARRARGPVWGPGDPGVADDLGGSRGVRTTVLGARDHDDVAVGVAVAAEHDLPVTVAPTGHPLPDTPGSGVLISTRRMRELIVDRARRSVRVGAGVVWSELVDVAARHGLAPPTGYAPDVGVVDQVLRGGLGPLARTLGFAADHVEGVELVTADGVVRRVDAEHDVDLFWALRGGARGGPPIGVVTSIDLALDPAAPLHGGRLVFADASAASVLDDYPGWSASLGEATTSSLSWRRGTPGVALRIVHSGGDPAGPVEAPVEAMRAHGPVVDTLAAMPATALATSDGEQAPSSGRHWARGLLLRELHEDVLEVLREALADPPASVTIHHLGGATNLRPAVDDAIGGRHARYGIVLVEPVGPGGGPSSQATRLVELLAPYAAGTATVTPTGSGTDVAADPDSATRARLADLADRIDPERRFRAGRPVAPRHRENAGSRAPGGHGEHADRTSLPRNGGSVARSATGPESRAILELARPWRSVAEIASALKLPLGVVRVLLADLDEAGLVTVHRPPSATDGSGDAADTDHLERALRGLRKRL